VPEIGATQLSKPHTLPCPFTVVLRAGATCLTSHCSHPAQISLSRGLLSRHSQGPYLPTPIILCGLQPTPSLPHATYETRELGENLGARQSHNILGLTISKALPSQKHYPLWSSHKVTRGPASWVLLTSLPMRLGGKEVLSEP
jgi:hypothetical protein